jgi:ankyrin repeat protein
MNLNAHASDTYYAIARLLHDPLPDAEHLQEIRSRLESKRGVVHEQDEFGTTLLHRAANVQASSLVYCRVLIEFDSTRKSLQLSNSVGELPFHSACEGQNIETARYLLGLHPDSINVLDDDRENCLHMLCIRGFEGMPEDERIIDFAKFLLERAPWLISSTTSDGDFPLHFACQKGFSLSGIQFLYTVYPQAIYAINDDGKTPLAEAQESEKYHADMDERNAVLSFLQGQLLFLVQVGLNWQPEPPIHRAILNQEVHQGTIKLMLSQNTQSLGHADSNGNLPIHIACAGGKCAVVEMILKMTDAGLSVQNSEGKIPIQLLLYDADCNRNSLEYMQAVHALLRGYPGAVMSLRR